MAKVFIEETTLSSIGDAIRDKGGTSELISPLDMPNAIINLPSGGGGGDIEVEPIVLAGDCSYACAGPIAGNYVKLFGDTISTKYVYTCDSMFKGYKNDIIPFDINCDSSATQITLSNMFYEAGIKQLPRILNCKPRVLNNLFYRCNKVREIPDDFFNTWDWSYLNTYTSGSCAYMFHECESLRSISTNFLKNAYNARTSSGCVYYYCFNSCASLDEINGWVVVPITLTSNVFSNTFNSCYRLKNVTFETNEDGTPKTAQWKSQVIDFTVYVGYVYYTNKILDYNSGITADKEVKDDATYQALKNDPDWFSTKLEYSRYNHDSAVNTINSLPDTSAYGTNTIKFKGAAGALTDGGAINTLTEEEIAVAAAKGWTVSFV